jgi:hypothetical protein
MATSDRKTAGAGERTILQSVLLRTDGDQMIRGALAFAFVTLVAARSNHNKSEPQRRGQWV